MDNNNSQFRGQSYGNQQRHPRHHHRLGMRHPLYLINGSKRQQQSRLLSKNLTILRKQKPKSKKVSLASTIYVYFGNLIHGKNKNERFRGGSANDTAKNPQQQTAWWRRFKSLSLPISRRSKGPGKKRNQKFLWCFRPVGAAAAAIEKKQNPMFWTTFEKKNQLELSEQFERLRTANRANDCFELEDKKISGGKVVVNVMLKEGIAFVLDPEWSEPMTFEITQLPKLTLYQRLRARHDYKRWYKRQQQQHLHHQGRPV
ncbi:hypothetical protein PS6_004747 [Mucor atramentarius]